MKSDVRGRRYDKLSPQNFSLHISDSDF